MKTIIHFCKRVYEVIRRFLGKVPGFVKNNFWKTLALIVSVIKRGTFVLPKDEFEKLEVQQFTYKTLTIILAMAVLFTGVWLDLHGYPSWTALLLFALRLIYAMPAKRVERALRQQQAQDREKIRAAHARAKSA